MAHEYVCKLNFSLQAFSQTNRETESVCSSVKRFCLQLDLRRVTAPARFNEEGRVLPPQGGGERWVDAVMTTSRLLKATEPSLSICVLPLMVGHMWSWSFRFYGKATAFIPEKLLFQWALELFKDDCNSLFLASEIVILVVYMQAKSDFLLNGIFDLLWYHLKEDSRRHLDLWMLFLKSCIN